MYKTVVYDSHSDKELFSQEWNTKDSSKCILEQLEIIKQDSRFPEVCDLYFTCCKDDHKFFCSPIYHKHKNQLTIIQYKCL